MFKVKSNKRMLLEQEKWLCDAANRNNERKIAITITYKGTKERESKPAQFLTESIARNAVERFYQRVNKEAFGNAADRYGKCVFLLTAFEDGNGTKLLHAHLSIGVPSQMSVDEFMEWCKTTLKLDSWVNEQLDIQYLKTKEDESRWHHYLCKEYVDIGLFETGPIKISKLIA